MATLPVNVRSRNDVHSNADGASCQPRGAPTCDSLHKSTKYPYLFVKLIESLVPATFRSSLDATIRRFFLCTLLACVGNGLTLSMFVIYLHNVRGFSTSFSTLLLGLSALVALFTGPLWGSATDRFGPVPVIVLTYVADAVGLVAFALAHTKFQAVGAATMLATFGGGAWGPGATLLSRLVPEPHRQRAFGFNFMLVNLGIGFGALISATIVDLHHAVTFTVLYIVNAGVSLVTGLLFFTLRAFGGRADDHHADPAKDADGWARVIADRRLVQYVLASLVLMIGGYGSLEAGFSLFVVDDLRLPVHVIGLIFFFNTSAVVLAQLWVLNKLEGRSRTRIMAIVGVFWFTFWVILDVALALPAILAVGSLCVAMVVFAIGETMLSPVGPALVNEIAPEHLRGRYNAASGMTWGLAASIGPIITALYFQHHLGNWWPLSTGLTALVGSALMLNLRRRLSTSEDGRRSEAVAP